MFVRIVITGGFFGSSETNKPMCLGLVVCVLDFQGGSKSGVPLRQWRKEFITPSECSKVMYSNLFIVIYVLGRLLVLMNGGRPMALLRADSGIGENLSPNPCGPMHAEKSPNA